MKEILTKQHGKVLFAANQHVKHLVSHILYFIGFNLMEEPVLDTVFVRQVTFVERGCGWKSWYINLKRSVTFIESRNSVFEVYESRNVIDAVFFRLCQIVDFDEADVLAVALVINFF